jgi:hypothetical protein
MQANVVALNLLSHCVKEICSTIVKIILLFSPKKYVFKVTYISVL